MSSRPCSLIPPVSLYFEGAGKKEQRRRADTVRDTLHSAGIDRDTLSEKWGVTLWRAFFKDKRAVLTFDSARGKTDWKGLEQWLSGRLKEAGYSSVRVIERPLKKCCGEACKSCLNGNKQARKDWVI